MKNINQISYKQVFYETELKLVPIIISDIQIDTTHVDFFKNQNIDSRILILEKALENIQAMLSNSKQPSTSNISAILTAPEYFFSLSNTVGHSRYYSEDFITINLK